MGDHASRPYPPTDRVFDIAQIHPLVQGVVPISVQLSRPGIARPISRRRSATARR
jgi:hypothetical protein